MQLLRCSHMRRRIHAASPLLSYEEEDTCSFSAALTVPDRALYSATFSHMLIVNKPLSLSLSLSLARSLALLSLLALSSLSLLSLFSLSSLSLLSLSSLFSLSSRSLFSLSLLSLSSLSLFSLSLSCHMAKRRERGGIVLAIKCCARASRGGVTGQGVVLTDLQPTS
jgi:hypothetical protein